MAVYYVPNVYQTIVAERAEDYFRDISRTSPEVRLQAQRELSALVTNKAEQLESTDVSHREFDERMGVLRQVLLVAEQLECPDPSVLMHILRKAAEAKVTMEEVIERAKGMGIGTDDEEAVYEI